VRLRELALRSFRGIEERRLEFPARGVVVVEGPNEIGKSSLAEALDLLLEELDSTRKRRVQAVQPVHRDEGPEVEALIESGPYRFRYRKRFLKQPETVLQVEAPRAENLTGRAAHERVQRILEETMDTELWRALRVVQGEPLSGVPLGQVGSLGRALDAATGQETAGEREDTLFERVQAEYALYYTETGREKTPLKEAAAAGEAARDALEAVRAERATLERDIERSERLERRRAELRTELARAEEGAKKHEKELAALEKTQEQVATLRAQASMAEAAVRAARREWQHRRDRIETAEAARKRLARLEEESARSRPALVEAEKAAKEAAEALARAEKEAAKADERFDRAGYDFKFRHYELDLKKMRVRRDAVAADRKRRAEAKELLEKTLLDAKSYKALKETYLEVERVRARAESQGARLFVEALGDAAVEIDGEAKELKAGEIVESAVTDESRLEVPGLLRIAFRGGAGAGELAGKLAKAEAAYKRLLDRAKIASLDEADEAMRRRAEAELVIEQCDAQIRQNLDDLSYEELVERVEGLQEYVTGYLSERTGDLPVPEDYDAAKAANREAREARERAATTLREARGRHDEAQARHAAMKESVGETAVEIKVAVRECGQAEQALQAERERKPDERLQDELAQAGEKAKGARNVFDEAQRTLADRRPATVKELAVNAEKAAARTAKELRDTEDELRELSGRLAVRGGEGLFEREQEMKTRHERSRRELESVRARAGAAKRLYDTMAAKHDEARRAYAAPLREKIEQLGRLVFDASLEVELDDDLAIATRTLKGRTLPVESLSGGAREQLALVSRLAAALLVDESDGVPVILDDALGYSDPARLDGLGALLRHAGEHAQIIVLTCTPSRFRRIGEATTIRL